jgi:hypothetical protein
MSLLRLTAALSLALAAAAPAADSLPTGKYELRNRSAYDLPESSRPPFWPIGWVKKSVSQTQGPATTAPAVVLDENGFVVTSILLGNPARVVINGRSYMEGEFLKMPKKDAAARVRVRRVLDGVVELQYQDQILMAKLRRAEIGPKNLEEEVLNAQRE